MSERRRLAILMNPSSAGGKTVKLLPKVEAELKTLGLPYRVITTQNLEHAGEIAKQAASDGEVPVAYGGDGMVGGVAAALGNIGPMGVLPGGRGNDFARALGIPLEVEPACRVLAAGRERKIDLGSANGKPFACIASIGYDSVANRRANETRFIKGNLVYAWAALRTLASWKPVGFTVDLDGVEHGFSGYNVVVANTSYYGGGMMVAPDADPADGMYDVLFIEDVPKRTFLSRLPKIFKGEHVEERGVHCHRAHAVSVKADRPLEVYADGEPITNLPVELTVLPKRLRLIAP